MILNSSLISLFLMFVRINAVWAQGLAFEGSTVQDDFVYYNMTPNYITYHRPSDINIFPQDYKPAVKGSDGQVQGDAPKDSDEILAVSNCYTQPIPGNHNLFDEYYGSYVTVYDPVIPNKQKFGRYYTSFLKTQYCGVNTATKNMLLNSISTIIPDPSRLQSKVLYSVYENEKEFDLSFYEDNDNDKVTSTLKARCELKRKELLKRIVSIENTKCSNKFAKEVNENTVKNINVLQTKKSNTIKPITGKSVK